MSDKPKILFTVRLTKEHAEKLDRLAKRSARGRGWPMTKSDVVRELIAKA